MNNGLKLIWKEAVRLVGGPNFRYYPGKTEGQNKTSVQFVPWLRFRLGPSWMQIRTTTAGSNLLSILSS